jgi:phage tail protein X
MDNCLNGLRICYVHSACSGRLCIRGRPDSYIPFIISASIDTADAGRVLAEPISVPGPDVARVPHVLE